MPNGKAGVAVTCCSMMWVQGRGSPETTHGAQTWMQGIGQGGAQTYAKHGKRPEPGGWGNPPFHQGSGEKC